MQVTVTISDDMIREAGRRNMNIVEYIESLIDKGWQEQDRPSLFSAMDRIRQLHEGGRGERDAEDVHHLDGLKDGRPEWTKNFT